MPPSPIKVGPYPYEVEYTDLPEDQYGECDLRELTIRLSADQAEGQERDSVLHEVMHAAWDLMSIGGSAAAQERAVRGLATGVLMVLRDNPELVRYLCG